MRFPIGALTKVKNWFQNQFTYKVLYNYYYEIFFSEYFGRYKKKFKKIDFPDFGPKCDVAVVGAKVDDRLLVI